MARVACLMLAEVALLDPPASLIEAAEVFCLDKWPTSIILPGTNWNFNTARTELTRPNNWD